MSVQLGLPTFKRQDDQEVWDNITEVLDPGGNVSKFVFTKDNAVAESVLYKYNDFNTRTVICCSTQSGCPVGCRFCGAGDNFVRSLTTEEIVSQPVHLLSARGIDSEQVDKMQIMFMSMGEPMLNLKRLIPALHELHEKYPRASLLISSSGPDVPYEPLIEASVQIPAVGLQFSVHESTDEARDKLIPFKRKLTLKQIAETGVRWYEATGRQPYFNYCVHENNNTLEDVARLKELFDPTIWQSTLSVISERDESIAAANARQRELVDVFMTNMLKTGYSVRMFDPEGQDTIGGGCGQLWYVQEWMREHPELAKPSIGNLFPKVHTPGMLKR